MTLHVKFKFKWIMRRWNLIWLLRKWVKIAHDNIEAGDKEVEDLVTQPAHDFKQTA